MRVSIVSRIFEPEPAAAAFRLEALASELAKRGHDVDVVTSATRDARGFRTARGRITVSRAPVLRDRSGSVRGYVPYLSFDVPVFFRLLFMRRPDIYVVEPPPTTGLVVRLVAFLRRRPYVYFAGDVVSDAAEGAGSPRFVLAAVRRVENLSMMGARHILAVSEGVLHRLRELGVDADKVSVVGNGVDTRIFRPDGERVVLDEPYVLYAGTASEVHGAGVFVDALKNLDGVHLVFLGGGTEFRSLRRRAEESVPGRVTFLPSVPPPEAAAWFRGAAVSLGSVRPAGNYDFAFPTKLYAASACGSPIVFSGPGPGGEYAAAAPLGRAVDADPASVAEAIRHLIASNATAERRHEQADWAQERASLVAVAQRSADSIESLRPKD